MTGDKKKKLSVFYEHAPLHIPTVESNRVYDSIYKTFENVSSDDYYKLDSIHSGIMKKKHEALNESNPGGAFAIEAEKLRSNKNLPYSEIETHLIKSKDPAAFDSLTSGIDGDVALLFHRGSTISGIPNEKIAESLSDENIDCLYLGSCGASLVADSFIKGMADVDIYGRPHRPWNGINPYGKDMKSAMYSVALDKVQKDLVEGLSIDADYAKLEGTEYERDSIMQSFFSEEEKRMQAIANRIDESNDPGLALRRTLSERRNAESPNILRSSMFDINVR
jgi:hypothetical protein